MYLFTIPTRIKPNSEAAKRFPDIGGAYVNCCIQFTEFEAAEKLARLLVRERGWIPNQRTEASVVRKKFLKTKKDKQFYAAAIKYGYTLVFNLWVKEAPDADVDYEEVESA